MLLLPVFRAKSRNDFAENVKAAGAGFHIRIKMSPLHPTVSFPPEFPFHNSTDKKSERKGRVIFISLTPFLGFMFPAYVHPQRVWGWSVESTVGTGESLGDLVLGFNVPPHVRQLCCAVFTVVFTVVQAVLPPLVLAWKILVQVKRLLSVADFYFSWHLMSCYLQSNRMITLMLFMISPHVSPVRTPWWTYLLTKVTFELGASQMFHPHVFLHIVLFLAGVTTVETLPYCLSILIAPFHYLFSNLPILVI